MKSKKYRIWSSLSLLGEELLVKKRAGYNTHEPTVVVISIRSA